MVYQTGLVNLSLIETRGSSHGPASARASAWPGGEEPTSSASNFFFFDFTSFKAFLECITISMILNAHVYIYKSSFPQMPPPNHPKLDHFSIETQWFWGSSF